MRADVGYFLTGMAMGIVAGGVLYALLLNYVDRRLAKRELQGSTRARQGSTRAP